MKDITYWKGKYETAKSDFGDALRKMKDNKAQYDGELKPKKGRETTCLYNFTKELIETELDVAIPIPKVEPKVYTERNVYLAGVIENMLRGEIKRLELYGFNDIDERNAKVMGADVGLVDWDNTIKTHYTVGAVALKNISPLRFVPQVCMENVEDMDYIFFDYDITKASVKKIYGVDVSNEVCDDLKGANEDICTIHYCFYKSTKGHIGCFAWVGDTVVIDEEHYNARQKKVCKKCGLTKPLDSNECICGSKEWVKRPVDYEELDEDMYLFDGRVVPKESYARDDEGNLLYRDVEVQQTEIDPVTGMEMPVLNQIFDDKMNVIGEEYATTIEQEAYLEPTKIPYYVPKGYPVLVRKNISKVGEIIGESDCEFIRELQLDSDMLATRMVEKALKSGSILTKPRGLDFTPSNSEQVINIDSIEQLSQIAIRNLEFDVSQQIALINQNYMWAKSALGINDSAQGKKDTTALSGAAKETQIARMLGRQESKTRMKDVFYENIYTKIFQYMLAYADEPRHYTAEDTDGNTSEVLFNRYDFLEQDEYGNWYYNDQFIITIDASGNSNDDRTFVLNTMQNDFLGGLYGNIQDPETLYNFWSDRAEHGYPNAKRQAARWKKKVDEMKNTPAPQIPPVTNDSGLSGVPSNGATQIGDLASPTEQAQNAVMGEIFGGLGGEV